ncbi:MAG: hypothetical protein JNL50_12010 [Phycisphaerae bacterium]|nr:hypothetical protein [Phycisphaerae bacterium]
MMRTVAAGCVVWLGMVFGSAQAAAQSAWECIGEGTITDSTHPNRPGDFRTYNVRVRVALDEQTGEGEITIGDKDRDSEPPDRYFWRRGRLFQSNDAGDDLAPKNLGDLAPATLAMIHPALLSAYIKERSENMGIAPAPGASGAPQLQYLIASTDVLWWGEAGQLPPGLVGGITALSRSFDHDVRGTMFEVVRYDGHAVTITHANRQVARLEFADPTPIDKVRTPKGDPARDAAMVIPPEEFIFRDLGGGLLACELARANARVFVVEFEDHLLVFEGVYTTRNAETLATAVRERFKKPVKFFAFSHIHGQYVGGVRAWAHEGATILVPPTTAALIKEVLAANFLLREDAWSHGPREATIEPVPERWSHEDKAASLVILNDRESDHTDEYFIVYLPRIKTLLTGDLLFYRPGKALSGRSLTLAKYVEKLGLEVDRCVTTWPLEWPGVKNEVTGDELRGAAKPE